MVAKIKKRYKGNILSMELEGECGIRFQLEHGFTAFFEYCALAVPEILNISTGQKIDFYEILAKCGCIQGPDNETSCPHS